MKEEKFRLLIAFKGSYHDAMAKADHVTAVIGLEGKARYRLGKSADGTIDGIYVRGRLDQGVSHQDTVHSLFAAFRQAEFTFVPENPLSPKARAVPIWRMEI